MVVAVKKCFQEPKYFLRLVGLIVCICVACYQLSACFQKLLHPPKSTRYDFDLNETLNYPAVTICRNPGFKISRFPDYGIFTNYLTFSSLMSFAYENHTLEDFFDAVTYDLKEFVILYGFDGFDSNLTISTFYTLTYGRCFKFVPNRMSELWNGNNNNEGGYFFYMRERNANVADAKSNKRIEESSNVVHKYHVEMAKKGNAVDGYGRKASIGRSGDTTGYHVFLHDRVEMFTENPNQRDSFTEYVYVMANGEELEVSLRPQEFRKISNSDEPCVPDLDYTQSKCKEWCAYRMITEAVDCYVPWIPNKRLPLCDDYASVSKIVKYYANFTSDPNYLAANCHHCIKSCNINVYSPFVRYRKDAARESNTKKMNPGSTLTIYYSSNLVSRTFEVITYDWNLFLSDLGGSLGFLLGLSVISVLGAIEQICENLISKAIAKKSKSSAIQWYTNGECETKDASGKN